MKILFDYKYPSLNEYINACRSHWSRGARMKRECDAATALMVRMQRVKPVTGPVRIRFVWHERTARRDWDNIRFAAKFVLDGLVKAGVLPDDGQAWVRGLSDEVVVDGRQFVECFMEDAHD